METSTAITRSSPYVAQVGGVVEDESIALTLWREGGTASPKGVEADRARYAWFYLGNPQGRARVNLVSHGPEQRPIGFLGIGARRFFLGGAEIAAGILIDFVVNPQHRSVFPALLLQRESRAQALTSMQMLYGLPDTKAVAICKRLESQVTFELPRYVRILRSVVYLERLAPRWAVAPLAWFADTLDAVALRLQTIFAPLTGEWSPRFDARFDRLWARLDKSRYCIGSRNAEFLAWRFGAHPGHDYRTFVVRRRNADDILAYFVCEIHDGIAVVRDMLSVATDHELKICLLLLSKAARRLGLRSVDVQVNGDEAVKTALRRAQFLLRSSRPFFAMVNEPYRQAASTVPWYITQADEDV